MVADDKPDICFNLASSRGAPVVKKLLADYDGVRITDNYGTYRNLPGQQQLCWVHLYRNIRDLRHNSNLPHKQRSYVRGWYEAFADIYTHLRAGLQLPKSSPKRLQLADKLWSKVDNLSQQAPPKTGEPLK